MALRPNFDLKYALIKTYNVAAGQTVTDRQPVKFGSADNIVTPSAAADPLTIGIALETKGEGKQVQICLLANVVVPVTVGTGGATRGKGARRVADGYTDAATPGAGAVITVTDGQFMQSGVAGDVIGMMLRPGVQTSA